MFTHRQEDIIFATIAPMPKVVSSPAFDKSYKGLNPEQKDAVDTIHGPVMVIAGPGTGKTTLLTLRIANILKETDASASSILALTFTESAVSSMRQKLFGIIGTDAYRVQINTFHGFANDIIRRYPEYFPRIIGSRNIREIEIIKMIREIIDANDFAHIKPFGSPFHYVRDAVKSIQSLKREGITPEKFTDHIELVSRPTPEGVHNVDDKPSKKDVDVEVRTLRNKELAVVYKAYEAMLTERKLYDFDDMLLDVVAALRDNDTLRATLQERFQFILADEHQDANASQNAILELLCSFDDKPNLLIVGDEKQAIFRFQGASLENFLYFKRKFPSAKVIFLTSNYRSGQPILDAAHSLITKGSLPADAEHLRKPLIANTKDSANIRVVATSSEKEERAFIVAELRTAQKAGVSWEEIAIIYRDNKDARGIAEILEKTDIPFAIQSNVNVLDNPYIHGLIQLMRLALRPTDDILLGESLFAPFFALSPLDAYKTLAYAHKNRLKLSQVLSNRSKLLDAEISDVSGMSDAFEKILSWSRMARTRPFIEVFDHIVRESAFVAHIIQAAGSAETLKALEVLFEEAKNLSAGAQTYLVADFLEHIAIMEEHGSTLKMLPDAGLKKSVSLMTAHRAKGLEFERVFITGVTDGHWGNRRNRSLFVVPSVIETNDDDERRLLYVAITRAKREAILTFPATDTAGTPKTPSQFIEELDAESVTRETTEERSGELTKLAASFVFADPIQKGLDVAEKDYLVRLFDDQGLSVSALNNYLACPWKYFFVSLLRVPQAPSASSRFGTTLHLALRLLGESAAAGKKTTTASMKKIVASAAAKNALSEKEEEQFVAKGMKALPEFWKMNAPSRPELSLWEHSVETTLAIPSGEDVVLRGTIDRVDRADTTSRVTVVDYKTGRHKSRNEMLGKTKNGSGDFFRQLAFYKLLLSLEGDHIADKGILAFVEPEKGKYRSETFDLETSDVEDLKKVITKAVGEIRTLAFWDAQCGVPDCDYCSLSKVLKGKAKTK